MRYTKTIKRYIYSGLMLTMLAGVLSFAMPTVSYANNEPPPPDSGSGTPATSSGGSVNLDKPASKKYYCGGSANRIYTSINLGCVGKGNAIVDLGFAIIRFLSAGVGLVVIASIIYGGIQYTMSRGDPQATAAAVDRIRNSLFALLIFVFAYAIIDYIIPRGFLQ
jgi:hypothetical protein